MTMSNSTARLVFAGGGTGGHLFPAIAIADRIWELLAERRSVEIMFVGTQRGIEYRMRDKLGYPLELINVRGLARSLSLKNVLVPFVLAGALIQSWLLLRRFRPDVVIGTGGYVAMPVLRAAAWRKIPTVIQEQNSFPGITTRQAAKKAEKIYLGFAGAKKYLTTSAEIMVTGNPVRLSLADGDREAALREFDLDPAKKTILVLGGSQGARAVNGAVLASLQRGSLKENYQILWQTGKRDYKDVAAQAGSRATGCTLFPFAHDMAAVYAAADLAVARAGALTLAELQMCGVPSILIPYPHAAGDHQRKNAQEVAKAGMARVIDEDDFRDRDILAEAIVLMESEEYGGMKAELDRVRRELRPAADVIAEDIIELIETRRGGQ